MKGILREKNECLIHFNRIQKNRDPKFVPAYGLWKLIRKCNRLETNIRKAK
jgi:hypothetical protein